GREVPRRDPCPARRQDDSGGLRELLDRGRDLRGLVRHHAVLDLVLLAFEQLDEQLAAHVLPLTRGDAVGNSHDRRLASLGFSRTLTSPIVIALSIAFAMS